MLWSLERSLRKELGKSTCVTASGLLLAKADIPKRSCPIPVSISQVGPSPKSTKMPGLDKSFQNSRNSVKL